ncbi:MAG: hypothetical protein WC382_11655 [Methanoregulaceae archaeon]|jgi:hypothetical protein
MNNIFKISRFASNYRFLLVILFVGFIFSCGCVDTGNKIVNNSKNSSISPTLNDNTTFITIDPINLHKAGDSFNISGITNIESDRQIKVEVAEDFFRTKRARKDGIFYGVGGNATITESTNGINRWEFHVNTSGWPPQQYYVDVFPASYDENYSKVHSTLNLTS